MSDRSGINDEDLGIRRMHLRRGRAVERAMERLRAGLREEWRLLSRREIDTLGWVLGELWAYDDRTEWDDLHFSKLRMHDVRVILDHARELKNNSRGSVEVLEELNGLIEAKG